MRICLLNDSFPPVVDGVANVVLNYANVLSKNHEVIVATPKYPDGNYDNYPFEVVPYHSFATEKITSGYRSGYPFDIKELNRIVNFKPDIIHTHCPMASTVVARVLRESLGVPIILTYHTKYDIDIARAIKAKLLQKASIKAIVDNVNACDEIWAVSKGAASNLNSLGYKGNCKIVFNGVDFPKGKMSEEEINKATKGYDLPDVPIFLYVGRMMNYKGLPMIIDALKDLKDDYRMIFIGDGIDKESLIKQAISNGLNVDVNENGIRNISNNNKNGKVIFVGAINNRDELRCWNSRADVFVFPSTFDTNGLVVREAAACELASILIKDCAASEGIIDRRNGFLIDENKDALKSILQEVINHKETFKKAGKCASEEIYLSWDDAIKNVEVLYAELLEKKEKGLLDIHQKEIVKQLFEVTNKLIEDTQAIITMHQTIREGMMDNFDDVIDMFVDQVKIPEIDTKDIHQNVDEQLKELENIIKQAK